MEYKLEGYVSKLRSPVIVVIDGIETEFDPAVLLETYFPKRYEISLISAKNDKLILELSENTINEPFNYVGETAINQM